MVAELLRLFTAFFLLLPLLYTADLSISEIDVTKFTLIASGLPKDSCPALQLPWFCADKEILHFQLGNSYPKDNCTGNKYFLQPSCVYGNSITVHFALPCSISSSGIRTMKTALLGINILSNPLVSVVTRLPCIVCAWFFEDIIISGSFKCLVGPDCPCKHQGDIM